MKTLIIEDEKAALRSLKAVMQEVDTDFEIVGEVDSIFDGVEWFRTHPMPELVFMDIHLADGSAFDICAQVDITCPIIFTTAYDEYALRAFKVNSVAYLLKPITYDDFMGSCQKVFESYMQDDNYNPIKRDGFLVVKRDYKCVRIPIDDILFVDCDKDYIRFHLEDRPNIRTLGNLKQLEERLPREKFKRVHRSFLANMTKFDMVDQQHITYGDQSIPISETYFEFIKKYLEDHSL